MLPHVFAYLDLASGSMIVQAAIAGIVVVPVMFRNKIRHLLGRNKPTDDTVLLSESDGLSPDLSTDVAGTDAAAADRS
jgi:hypothetical protein